MHPYSNPRPSLESINALCKDLTKKYQLLLRQFKALGPDVLQIRSFRAMEDQIVELEREIGTAESLQIQKIAEIMAKFEIDGRVEEAHGYASQAFHADLEAPDGPLSVEITYAEEGQLVMDFAFEGCGEGWTKPASLSTTEWATQMAQKILATVKG